MTGAIALLLVIIVVAMILFSWERLPTDVTAMGILLVLILTGLLPPEQAFAGFASDTAVMIFGLLVLTTTLVHTGVSEMAGRQLLKLTGKNAERLLAIIMVTAAVLSAFISNTATTALFVPITLTLARRLKLNASKLLMPLAFAAILASSVTLISSSTNLVISGILQQHDMLPLGMFELTLVGVPIALVGLAYMQFIGRHIIPNRSAEEAPAEVADLRPYLSEIVIQAKSSLVGKTLNETGLGHDMDLTVMRVGRGKNRYLVPQAHLELHAGDKLLVKGPRNALLKFALNNAETDARKPTALTTASAETHAALPQIEPFENSPAEAMNLPEQTNLMPAGDIQLAEVILLPRSALVGRSLVSMRFRQRYGLQILGLNRRGKNIYRKLSQVVFRTGDQLLIQGPRAIIETLDKQNAFRVLGNLEVQQSNRRRAPWAIGIFGVSLLLAATNLLPLPVAVWAGALLVFATGCINPSTAYHSIEWKVLMVIGSMLAIGRAMELTGTAAFLAHQIIGLTVNAGPLTLLTIFFGLTMALTQPMSNQAAAVIVLPVALETALQLNLNPRTFAIMIAVGASCSFITPLEPSCLIVYGPGRYRFSDFIKVGSLLTLIIYLIAIFLIPQIWPL